VTVNFSYRVGTGTPTNIGTATRVGSTETYEFNWPASAAPADGEYDLVATLSSGGATPLASDSEEVVVNNTTEGPPDNIPLTNAQSETVEITNPVNGGTLTFTEGAGDVNLQATIQVKHSADVSELTPYFTTTTPGSEPVWAECDSGSETAAEAANGVDCELPPGTNGTSVTGVAVVASDEPNDPIPEPVDPESGDAHRVFGSGASPGPSPSTTSPSPTQTSTASASPTQTSTASPSPSQTSTASPSPTQTTASPSPTTTTPPPPVAYSSQTTMNKNGNKFVGKVKSDNKKCRRGRNVVLKEQKPGKDKTVGKDKTNKKGKYSIKERNADGTYYTIAKSKSFTDRFGRPVTCQRDKSPKREA
jgi:hypothetical protein